MVKLFDFGEMGVLLLHSAVFLCLCLGAVDAKQKPVKIALSGKWKSTPLLLEASEFLAKESSDSFWTFVGRIAEHDADSIQTAPDDIKYKLIQKFASELLSPLQLSFLKFSLALRAYSPAVNMYQQIVEQIDMKKDCVALLDINGRYTCNTNEMSELLTTAMTRQPSTLYQFDHVYPGLGQRKVVVIFYAELGTKAFVDFHPALAQLAAQGEITYVLRHYVKNEDREQVTLSGYGVDLAIKSTEYKAKDDTKVEGGHVSDSADDEDDNTVLDGIDFSKLRQLHPELKTQLKEFRIHLFDSASELRSFKVWQLQDLSLQASQKVLNAPIEESLQTLQDISQNFPLKATSLVHTHVLDEFKKEVRRNQEKFEMQGVGAGDSLLYLNGLAVDMEIYDIFTLLDVMASEARLVEGLHALGFKGDNMEKFLQLDHKDTDDQSYGVDVRHSAVQYLNDLATDKKYRTWPNSVQDLLRPTFPGMLRHIAKNIFHLVFVVDPTEATGKGLLKMAEAFLVHKAPLRLGIAFVVNPDPKVDGFSDAGVALVRAYTFVSMDKTPGKGLSFITDVYEKVGSGELTQEAVISEFTLQYPGEYKDLVFGDSNDYDDVRKAGADFVSRSGLRSLPQVLVNGVPLEQSQLGDSFEEAVVMEVMKQTQIIQAAVYKGDVSDKNDILDWWMERDNILPRLNSRVLAPPNMRLDLTSIAGKDLIKEKSLAAELNSKDLTAAIADDLAYVTKRDEDAIRPVTMWIVADLETKHGRELVYNALKHVKSSKDVRLSIIFNPSSTEFDQNSINRAVWVTLKTQPGPVAKILLTKLVKEENAQALLDGTKTLHDLEVHGMDIGKYISDLSKESTTFLKVHKQFTSRVLSLKPGERAVITNGAVLGPLAEDEEISVEDLNLIERLAYNGGGQKVKETVQAVKVGPKTSDLVMKLCSLLASQEKHEKRHKINYHSDKHSVVKIPADSNIPAFTVEAILDPVSRQAQKMTPILKALQQIANVDVRIYLNPREKLSEMPLKSFYRFVLEPEISFDVDGTLTHNPAAQFQELPQKSLLTLSMDTPESWLVEAVTSPYDLDNILLEEVERSVSAQFELEYILLEGHCSDSTTMQPPRGLQFVLGTKSHPALMDTIVMANLGYFQLKANPGLWTLNLRDGRSNEIYNIESHENTDSPVNHSQIFVAINSFKSKIIRVKVAKKPDKASMNLLGDSEDVNSGGLWDSISSTFTGGSATKDEEKDTTLNIFSVASGHLYERFLRIMMLSVTKNTKSKVKFWFLKNYLSPSFKDFIPYMAQEYGFEYELVQYKWPRWLNQQKEKQRIIWGYKILFLDVLFPLDVKKFIFVDADQIVRTDLQELHDLDLGGAPYGYTPFCDSRKEMDGFRFWNSGYWKSHLAGRKYHISALYVVDLKRFRRIAAGDRLRGQYQGLSQDPNSLANLDQDLPNNMIHQVSIKSLPQEWLYCETWCDVSEKSKAKTIDLCNNPLTKEPKLAAAMRIVPEWKDYDYEIKVLWDEIYHTNTKDQIEYDPPSLRRDKDKSQPKKEEL